MLVPQVTDPEIGTTINHRLSHAFGQRMILKKLKKTSDADAAPWIENEQVVILTQDDLGAARERKREHVIVLRIAAVQLPIKVRIDALPVTFDAFDQFDDRLGRDAQPRPRRDIAEFIQLFSMIEKLVCERSKLKEFPRRPRRK